MLYFVELSKFAAQLGRLDLGDERNRWLYMLTQIVHMSKREVKTMTPVFQRIYEECQITNFTDMDKQKYVRNVLEFDDVREMLECEREMAEQSGYERGMQQGMQKGREEALFQIAKNFLELGIPLADVAKATGVSEEEIIQRT